MPSDESLQRLEDIEEKMISVVARFRRPGALQDPDFLEVLIVMAESIGDLSVVLRDEYE